MADIQKPKRAANPYSLFNGHIRETVVNELKAKSLDGKANFGDIARGVKARWEALSESERNVWAEKAAASKEAAAEAMQAYKEAAKDQPEAKGKKEKDENMPKKAQSSWLLFSGHHRPQVVAELKSKSADGKTSLADIAGAIKRKWDALSPVERKEWDDKAAAGKEEADAAREAYKEAKDPAGALRAKYADLIPKKPPHSYQMFCQEAAVREQAKAALEAENGPCSWKDIMKKIGALWEQGGAELKTKWQDKHTKATEEFKVKWAQWERTPEFAEISAVEVREKRPADEIETPVKKVKC